MASTERSKAANGAEGPQQSLQALERALAVLEVVAAHAESGCRLSDVIERTTLGRATTHRFIKSLQTLGLIELEERSARYFPGVRLAALGVAGVNRFGLAQRATPHLKRLAELTGDTVYLTVRVDDEAMCVAREEGSFPIKTLTARPGDRRPLGVGAGSLALLAFLEGPPLEELLRAAAPRVAPFGLDPAVLTEMVAESRSLGYALNNGHIIPGMTGIGFPIRSQDGTPVAAFSVAAINTRMAEARRAVIAAWLTEEANQLQTELGPMLGSVAAIGRNRILVPRMS